MKIEIKIIKQLIDNYSYVIYSKKTNEALVLDPSEPKPILDFLSKEKLILKGILITHHHSDHTQGISEIIKKFDIRVYTPNNDIKGTTDLLLDKQKIDFGFIDFEIIGTPGHTLDHIVYFNSNKKLLFCGDVLFDLGCGRVFEGTMKQMLNSLKKIKNLPNETKIYCGHEYTYKNLKFLIDELLVETFMGNNAELKSALKEKIKENGSSMPFILGYNKEWNPFLNSDDPHYREIVANCYKNKGQISADMNELEFFTFIRNKRNTF